MAQDDHHDDVPRWVWRALLAAFGLFILLRVGTWIFGRVGDLLVTLLVSLFVSFALEPAVNALTARGWRRGMATGAVFLGVIVAGIAFTVAIGQVVVAQTAQLIDNAPRYVEDLVRFSNDTFGTELSAEQISEELTKEGGAARNLATDLADNAVTVSLAAVGLLFRLLTIGLFSFYLVADGPRLRRGICSLLPAERQLQVLDTWELAVDKTGSYLYSRGLLAVLSGAFHWLAFSLLDIPYAAALALFVGVISQFVPVIGTYLAGIVPALVALADRPVAAVGVVAVVVVYQQIENYLFAPRITARTMAMHPAVAFGSVIAGGSILGPAGAVLALPAAAMIQGVASASLARHPVVESDLTRVPATPGGGGRWVPRLRRQRRRSGGGGE